MGASRFEKDVPLEWEKAGDGGEGGRCIPLQRINERGKSNITGVAMVRTNGFGAAGWDKMPQEKLLE